MREAADRPDIPDWLASIDPFASEQWLLSQGDDVLALAGHLSDRSRLPESAKIVSRFGDIVTLRVPRRELPALVHSGALRTIEGARRITEPDDSIASVAAADRRAYRSRPAGLRQDGAGVIVGVIDYGIDPFHPAFWHEPPRPGRAGRCKVRAVWDQRGRHETRNGNRWGYGRIVTRTDIERAATTADPYAAIDYRPWDSDRRGRGAHGTHVTGIAAGRPVNGDHAGVAPGADILFVSLGRTTPVLGESDLGSSLSILEALDWLFEMAGSTPIVVNLSVGAHSGHHNGGSVVERGIDAALVVEGRALVNSAGNYRNKAAHAAGRLREGAVKTLTFELGAHDRNGSELEAFYAADDDVLARIRTPDGDWSQWLPVRQSTYLRHDGARIGVMFHRESRYHGDKHLGVFLRPGAPAGRWRLQLKAESVTDGRYHAWIERDASQQMRFIGKDIEETSTIGTLANGRLSITVGAFDPHVPGEPLGRFSSLGPTRHGALKPELAAPGVRIVAARSTPRGRRPGPRLTTMTGTSMAAPTVTGALALMFAEAGGRLDITDTRALLLGSLRAPPSCGPGACARPDLHGVGHGYLDIPKLLAAASNWRNTMQSQPTPASLPDAHLSGDVIDDDAMPPQADTFEPEFADATPIAHFDFDEVAEHAACDACAVAEATPGLDDDGDGIASAPLDVSDPLMSLAGSGHIGSLLVRRSPGENVDYRAVVLTEPTDDIAGLQARGLPTEYRGAGLYAEVLELNLSGGTAGRAIRQVFNGLGLLPSGQELIPPALMKAMGAGMDMPEEPELVERLPSLAAWEDLISFRPSIGVQRSLVRRLAPDWSVHRIENAHGNINLDHYPVRIDRFPVWRGATLTPESMVALVRSDINRFIDTRIASFRPYDTANARRWRSPRPLGAVIHIDMKAFGGWVNPDDGSVVCSAATARDWIFSTIWTPGDFGHPVSGNRQFGIRERSPGVFEFFTRGADRTTGRLDQLMSGTVFGAADALWVSLQRRVVQFVNSNGGSARVLPRLSSRFDWPTVKRLHHRPTVGWI